MVLVRLEVWLCVYNCAFNIEDGKEKLKTIRNYFSLAVFIPRTPSSSSAKVDMPSWSSAFPE